MLHPKLKISVAMAAYKGERFIEKQLHSILSQTLPVDEIVISDDSPDLFTKECILKECAQWQGILKYMHNPNPVGVEKNFKHAVSNTSGDIIFLCDQDDIWNLQKVEKMIRVFMENQDCLVVAGSSELIDATDKPLDLFIPEPSENIKQVIESINSQKGFLSVCRYKMKVPGHALAMRKNFIPFFMRMPENQKFHDEWIVQAASFFEKFRYIPERLNFYRIHENNVSNLAQNKYKKLLLSCTANHTANSSVVQMVLERYIALYALRNLSEILIPPEDNLKLLENLIRYFEERKKIRSLSFCAALLHLKQSVISDYFKYGTGFRALIRDIFF